MAWSTLARVAISVVMNFDTHSHMCPQDATTPYCCVHDGQTSAQTSVCMVHGDPGPSRGQAARANRWGSQGGFSAVYHHTEGALKLHCERMEMWVAQAGGAGYETFIWSTLIFYSKKVHIGGDGINACG